ncbi:uncharacterized protein FMAN_13738 [Fusarium mangiferae]|uniref:Xylanolytic transcriptional activator regulatory domain-containing protein n=1 Tax=Fusarium mangiferae TaxID=192010 RepID=A0A1L7TG65_FUSMA|nr:uncharacterized protein FMAN_13738 [Fusarium mangiferae]CVK95812.1 uncharacterized protein FMAN_13738 [Fusarium mangiferae]
MHLTVASLWHSTISSCGSVLTSHSYAAMYEARYRELDELCQRLQVVAAQLTKAIDKLPQGGCTDACSHTPPSVPSDQSILPQQDSVLATGSTITDSGSNGHSQPRPSDADDQHTDKSQEQVNNSGELGTQAFGSLVHDSYGALRFVGGANNEFLLQAVDSLTLSPCQGSDDSPYSVGSQQDTTRMIERPKPELPFFIHGLRWRDLPYLPKAEDMNLPPKYMADMLVGLYFEHYHYTFPVLYKPHFVESYKGLYTSPRGSLQDSGFLSVFFAVCACASSLTAPDGNHSSFPGLEFYEKALVLHCATTGQATKYRAQCLALMSMCCAGWNTLSTSWNFAGQAVRASQELGMHLEITTATTESLRTPAASIEVEVCRRIWWSIYCLDRITSICLGRPMAANDSDCSCALPLPLADEELDTLYNVEGTLDNGMNQRSALSGFLDLIGLCKVSGEVQSIQSPSEISELGSKVGQKRVMDLALGQERSLDIWLKDLPEHLQSSESYFISIMSAGSKSELSVQSLIIHDGTLVALYHSRTFARRKHSFSQRQTVENCVTAARSCINNSRHIRDFVPPSHYLALCVHYLTISGLVLLRMTKPESIREDDDLQLCIQLLGDLEVTWSGANRGKIIIEEVLRSFHDNQEGQQMNIDFQILFQNPDLDLASLDLSQGFFENFWGTFV